LYYLFAARVRVIDIFSEYYYMRMRAFLSSFSFQFPQSFDAFANSCSWRGGGGALAAEVILFSAATTAARARRRECLKQLLLPTHSGTRLAVVVLGCVAV
jgi:hypothetical protein